MRQSSVVPRFFVRDSEMGRADHQPRARIDVAGLFGAFFRLVQAG